jgi:hypothetical protein
VKGAAVEIIRVFHVFRQFRIRWCGDRHSA